MQAFLFRWYKVQRISKMTLMASILRLGLFCHQVVTVVPKPECFGKTTSWACAKMVVCYTERKRWYIDQFCLLGVTDLDWG